MICIGDNLNTDIKGANIQNFDSLLINNGIHKNEISNGIKELTKKYNVNVNYTPDGNYAVFQGGAPVATELKISFMETKLVFSEDIKERGF